MLQHLESGACKSKLDRRTINTLLKKHDTANIITIEGAGKSATPAVLPSWSSASHISSVPEAFEEVYTDFGDDEDGGVIFTPTSTPPRRGSIVDNNTPTSMGLATPTSNGSYGFTGILTPLSGDGIANALVCPICSKKFKQSGSVASHLASPVHSMPIYHCPKEFLAELGMKMDKHGLERTFTTLSGLAQHIQAGACAADEGAWEKVVKFLEEKLCGLGLDGVRLLTQ
jgi:hypothetical protein